MDEARRRFDDEGAALRYAATLDGTARHRRELRCIEGALADVAPGSAVLDLPCGAGRLLPMLLARGFVVTAADSSRHMLEEARKRATREGFASHVSFERADVMNTPFERDAFDAVVCNRLLHHFPEASARRAALAELARICRGTIVVSFFCSWSLSGAGFHAKDVLAGRRAVDRIPIGLSTMLADVAAAGLEVTRKQMAKPVLGSQWYLSLERISPRSVRP